MPIDLSLYPLYIPVEPYQKYCLAKHLNPPLPRANLLYNFRLDFYCEEPDSNHRHASKQSPLRVCQAQGDAFRCICHTTVYTSALSTPINIKLYMMNKHHISTPCDKG